MASPTTRLRPAFFAIYKAISAAASRFCRASSSFGVSDATMKQIHDLLEQADYALYVSIGLGVYLLWLMLTTPLPRRHR